MLSHGPPHDEHYVDDYEAGLLSRAAKQIMEVLVARASPGHQGAETRTHLEAARSRPVFDRAITELQRKLYITMIEARYEPTFTYVWDLLETWLPEPVARGREMLRHEAVYRLIRAISVSGVLCLADTD